MLAAVAIGMLLPSSAVAGNFLDHIRNYDLNDYAFGMSASVSQSPYVTAPDSVIVYPFLTSFRDPSFTDDWLLVNDGELGIRAVTQNDWVFGAVGRIETLGLGNQRTEQLLGLNDRQWTIELAPLAAYRGWPVHFQAKLFKEISGRHGGLTGQLEASLPRENSWGYIVPGLKVIRHDEDYTGYYYGVSPAESRADRPVYVPGAETSYRAFVRVGYQISQKWLLLGGLSYEKLGDEISMSPIVGREYLWAGNIGIAYNANIFRPREFAADAYRMPRLEFRVGVFQDNVNTTIVQNDDNGVPLPPIEVEDLLAISDREAVMQLDGIWRIGNYHRLEASYFALSRSSDFTLTASLGLQPGPVPIGADVEVRSDLRLLRLAYSYSLMSDAQKELGVMAGLHVSRLHTEIETSATGPEILTSASTPLPAVGVHGTVAIGGKTYLRAQAQFYRMHFDDYRGSMNYLNLVLQHVFNQNFSIGLGYNLYDIKLDSENSSIDGRVEIRHFGPQLFLGMHF